VAQDEEKKEKLPIKDGGDQGKDATSEQVSDNSPTQVDESKHKELEQTEATHSEVVDQQD